MARADPPLHDAALGFHRAVDDYERGRPSYPDEAIRCLVRELRIDRASAVLDLAAGTGKLTRMLARTGASVIAVEPLEPMRKKLLETVPEVTALAGTAEAIPLPDASVDAVAVAQAFHWFRGEAALAEIHRVLRPSGRLGLVWNVKDESVDWVARLAEIIEPYRGTAPRYCAGAWREAFARTTLFTKLEERQFTLVHELDRRAVVARVASISFISRLPGEERARALQQVRELLSTHPETYGKERLALPYRTDVFWCRRV